MCQPLFSFLCFEFCTSGIESVTQIVKQYVIFWFQLVPAVTELIVAELMYLQWMDPKEPIYLYINSTGTTRDDGETVSILNL